MVRMSVCVCGVYAEICQNEGEQMSVVLSVQFDLRMFVCVCDIRVSNARFIQRLPTTNRFIANDFSLHACCVCALFASLDVKTKLLPIKYR